MNGALDVARTLSGRKARLAAGRILRSALARPIVIMTDHLPTSSQRPSMPAAQQRGRLQGLYSASDDHDDAKANSYSGGVGSGGWKARQQTKGSARRSGSRCRPVRVFYHGGGPTAISVAHMPEVITIFFDQRCCRSIWLHLHCARILHGIFFFCWCSASRHVHVVLRWAARAGNNPSAPAVLSIRCWGALLCENGHS